ncbi:MAG: NitT/TauT family transport system permease protein [Rhodobacteraceae bacterium HLUCCA08]|nr:MAG: NitT/TauT family transport system permease protein [Rhodobacteraceae bacterium HLUCCA08]
MADMQDSETKQGSFEDADRIRKLRLTPAELWQQYGPWATTVLNLTIFFILWELFARSGMINQVFFPTASGMFSTLFEGLTRSAPPDAIISGQIIDHLLYTVRTVVIGIGLACIVGIPMGLLMGGSRHVERIFSPYVWALASLPRIALVPLFILFLGFTMKMQVTIVFLAALFPIVINAWAGVKTTEKSLIAAAKVFGANRRQIYYHVVLPYTLPFIIAGVQQGIGRGLVGVIIAEIFGGSMGLGFLITRAADTFNSELMYAVLLLLVLISLSLIKITRMLEAWIAPWRQQALM